MARHLGAKQTGDVHRFGYADAVSDEDGTIIDVYQAPTQIPDESGLDITYNINTLLDNAINRGYYASFVINRHMDTAIHSGSRKVIASAIARKVPVISYRQMLTWLDGRNGTVFSHITWVDNKLSFDLTTSAHNLRAMVPYYSADGSLVRIIENNIPVNYTVQTIKGIKYDPFSPAIYGRLFQNSF